MKNMKKFLINSCLAVACIFGLAACGGCGRQGADSTESPDAGQTDSCSFLGFEAEMYSSREARVRKGEFFSGILMKLGLSASEAYLLSDACDSVFDARTLRVGNMYQAYYGTDAEDSTCTERLKYLVYWQDRVNGYVFDCSSPYSAWTVSRPVVTSTRYADVTITSSLWNDMLDAGVSPLLILSLSDIYAWTVDFFGLQKGDRFRVVYDEKTCEGDVIAVDTVRYAVFTHRDEDFPAIMFNQHDGGNIYWNEKGESMRKAFLKAPLHYSRISSGFSYARRHPITRRVQPHTGVDYAAPAGTPVMSIGDGVVTSRKNEGAGGNVVRIRHNSVYSTAYLHLSGYASGLKVGQRVRQGDVIGYVGSTGRSTGPHLDFRVWKNGSPINPLKMQSPPAEPLNEEFRAEFEEICRRYASEIDSLQSAIPASPIG